VVNAFKSGGYEDFNALDDVSFEVKKGEFFGIIGRNGSGKSTLLKILAGIYQADKGKVKVNGMISPFLELGIGFNPELSGRDNVYLNATVLGMTQKQIDKKFDSIVKFSELERFIDQKLKNYSSGMQVRLAFSVSIHANRDILLMDEVLAVGDSNFQSKCLEEFNKYREMGRTVIIVTHDISVVERYCDRAMLLRNGKIVKIGKADEVADRYVFNNMSDEEKRFINDVEYSKDDQILDNIHPGIKNTVEIINVSMLDNEKKQKNVFQTGDDFIILIKFNISGGVKDLVFRVSFESADGVYLFGSDTYSYGHKTIYEVGENKLIFKIKNNLFLKGEYFVNVSCFNNNGTSQLDFKPKCLIFKIFSLIKDNGFKGFIKMEHAWKSLK